MNSLTVTETAKGGRAARRKTTMADLRKPDLNYLYRPSTQMLAAMAATGKHIYAGTVDPEEVKRRRRANRAARRTRAAQKRARRAGR